MHKHLPTTKDGIISRQVLKQTKTMMQYSMLYQLCPWGKFAEKILLFNLHLLLHNLPSRPDLLFQFPPRQLDAHTVKPQRPSSDNVQTQLHYYVLIVYWDTLKINHRNISWYHLETYLPASMGIVKSYETIWKRLEKIWKDVWEKSCPLCERRWKTWWEKDRMSSTSSSTII